MKTKWQHSLTTKHLIYCVQTIMLVCLIRFLKATVQKIWVHLFKQSVFKFGTCSYWSSRETKRMYNILQWCTNNCFFTFLHQFLGKGKDTFFMYNMSIYVISEKLKNQVTFNYLMLICIIMHSILPESNTTCSHLDLWTTQIQIN